MRTGIALSTVEIMSEERLNMDYEDLRMVTVIVFFTLGVFTFVISILWKLI